MKDLDPIQNLAGSLLIIAIKDMSKPSNSKDQNVVRQRGIEAKQAYSWMYKDRDDSPYRAGTFKWCCRVLGFSASRIRRLTAELILEHQRARK